uniref:Pentatricopeptide repeat-containing protein n=1 Tax=Ananas comosus var. bracteatus TaxID=296719 RepID=A0A6V7PQB8_ANACO|nr:unnamed protein product [Ananas comosus var. bracteatus]
MTVNGLLHLPSSVSKLVVAYSKIPTSESLHYAIKAFELLREKRKRKRKKPTPSCGTLSLEVTPLLVLLMKLLSSTLEWTAITWGFTQDGRRGGVQGDLFIQNSLVHFYVECGEMSCAQRVFDGMLQRNVVSWTSLIDGYAKGDCSEKAISLFHDMVRDGRIEPNSVTMACVLSACARLQDLMQGEKICSYISDSGVGSSSLVNPIIDMYMSCGATEKARQIFDDCKYRDIVLWNIMVSNYARNGMAKEALCVVNEMLLSKQWPDRVTVLAGLSASAQLGAIQVGKQLHAYILRNGLDYWDVVNNSVIDMYMKCRNEKAARKVFDIIRIKILATWNTIINGFENARFRTKPDTAALVSVASACGYLGSLDLAKWVYTYTQKKRISRNVRLGTALVDMFSRCGDSRSAMHVVQPCGVSRRGLHIFPFNEQHLWLHPQIVHYGCLVDLLSRAGLLAEARALIESMPMS